MENDFRKNEEKKLCQKATRAQLEFALCEAMDIIYKLSRNEFDEFRDDFSGFIGFPIEFFEKDN